MKRTKNVFDNGTIRVIDTHYLQPRYAASHMLIENGEALFVDVGPSPAHKFLADALAENDLLPEDVRYVILTHIHLDHAGGAGLLMRYCPNATLVVHPNGAKHISDPEKLITAAVGIYGKQRFTRLYGDIIPIPQTRILTIEDGYELDFHGRILKFFDTPGHARHHCSIWDPASKGIFSGDTLGMALPELQSPDTPPFLVPTTSPAAFDPDALEDSIDRLMQLHPERFYVTHFGPVLADHHSVESLKMLIRSHANIGRQSPDLTPPTLIPQILQTLYDAYCQSTDRPIDRERFTDLLNSDIELNAQGVAAWITRLKRNNA